MGTIHSMTSWWMSALGLHSLSLVLTVLPTVNLSAWVQRAATPLPRGTLRLTRPLHHPVCPQVVGRPWLESCVLAFKTSTQGPLAPVQAHPPAPAWSRRTVHPQGPVRVLHRLRANALTTCTETPIWWLWLDQGVLRHMAAIMTAIPAPIMVPTASQRLLMGLGQGQYPQKLWDPTRQLTLYTQTTMERTTWWSKMSRPKRSHTLSFHQSGPRWCLESAGRFVYHKSFFSILYYIVLYFSILYNWLDKRHFTRCW